MEVLWRVSLNTVAATITVCAFTSFCVYKYFRKSRTIPAIDAFKLDINVASQSEECKPLINEIRRRSMAHGHNAIGFDCEWVMQGSRKPVALLQLSTFDGYCVLIRMNLLDEIPLLLRQLLEDEDIYKVGVVPLNDAHYLYNDHGVATLSTIDLRHLAELGGYKPGGLAHLTEELLGVILDKRLQQLLEDEDIYKVGVVPLNDAHYLYNDHGVATLSTIDLRHLAELGGYKPGGLAHLTEELLGVILDKRLQQLLEDEDIYKVGVVPLNDAHYLYNDHGVATLSTIDLRHLAELGGYKPGGLAHLTEELLGVILDKRLQIRCGDWDAEMLSPEQLHYAASDAHAAIQIFVKLINKLDTPQQRKVWSLTDSEESIWRSLDEVCANFIDYEYKKINDHTKNQGSNNKCTEKQVSKRYPNCMRTKPLYDNCFLQAPDGDLLCTCDKKKALWYIEKGLADEIESDPLVVRLRFEPAGRAVGEVGQYYKMKKENHCVVCGQTNSYIRKNVVPREYRKYFPEIMKDRSSHDVLLLCGRCHQRSNIRDQTLRNKLATRASAPLQPDRPAKVDDTCKKVRMAARALMLHSHKFNLPKDREKELQEIVLSYYTNHKEVTEDLLKEACKLLDEKSKAQDNVDSHGLSVVKHFLKLKPNGLLSLEELWRQHFLTTMRPKHMPTLWSIKHSEERLRVKWDEGRLSNEDLNLIGVEGW